MRSQNRIFIDIIGICTIPPRMVCGETKRVEILRNGNNWREIIVVGVSGRGEEGLDQLPSLRYRMRCLEV